MLLASIFKSAAGPVRTASASASETNSKGKTYSGRGGYTGKPGIISDIQMGIGMVPKDQYYYSRTAATKARAAPVSRTEYGYKDKYGNITNPALSPEAIAARQQARRAPTAAELRAQRKAAELAERKRLGQIARKKFEKEGGEKTAKKKALLLNIT